MHVLAVGELYDPPLTRFESREAVRLGRNLHELVRFWPDPDPMERAAHQAGPAEFALIDESPHLLVLAYRFGDLPWCDSPFQIHRHREEDRAWPAGGPDGQIAMRTVLVDASTGIVVSLRVDALSLGFSNAVRVAVAEQLLHEPNDDEAQRRLNALYDKYPSSEVMARQGATIACSTPEPTLGGTRDLSISYY
ncbi:hypothetical protein [Nocardioides sp. Soil805]|uniref:hypothetical protein n=1 Tax=Nocardioides sp. Soil805 TaxID=1736416 RepID=UPI000702B365|nr:hypothetical protein [Nocardioides sp. Soil805]KRF37368.1 hypothetical protein ASG94_08585 [Nocardioides sp. Soil805]